MEFDVLSLLPPAAPLQSPSSECLRASDICPHCGWQLMLLPCAKAGEVCTSISGDGLQCYIEMAALLLVAMVCVC
jgi:hypothetical protein